MNTYDARKIVDKMCIQLRGLGVKLPFIRGQLHSITIHFTLKGELTSVTVPLTRSTDTPPDDTPVSATVA